MLACSQDLVPGGGGVLSESPGAICQNNCCAPLQEKKTRRCLVFEPILVGHLLFCTEGGNRTGEPLCPLARTENGMFTCLGGLAFLATSMRWEIAPIDGLHSECGHLFSLLSTRKMFKSCEKERAGQVKSFLSQLSKIKPSQCIRQSLYCRRLHRQIQGGGVHGAMPPKARKEPFGHPNEIFLTIKNELYIFFLDFQNKVAVIR